MPIVDSTFGAADDLTYRSGRLRGPKVCRRWLSDLDDITFRAADQELRREVMVVAKNIRQTGSKAASNAGKTLANPNSTPAEKSAAASALSQTPSHKNKKK